MKNSKENKSTPFYVNQLFLCVLFLICTMAVNAQVKFENFDSFDAMKKKAAKESKLIFIQSYSDDCRQCDELGTFAFNRDSMMTVILDLLDKKHCYEVSLNPNVIKHSSESKPYNDVFLTNKTKCKNTIIAFSNYENAISGIKSNKNILLFIDVKLNNGNDSLLNKKYILYNYELFHVCKSNKMTHFNFLRIIRHSLFELNMSDLPSLKDAVEYLKKS